MQAGPKVRPTVLDQVFAFAVFMRTFVATNTGTLQGETQRYIQPILDGLFCETNGNTSLCNGLHPQKKIRTR